MKDKIRMIRYDSDLKIEACHFKGCVQPFPNHFHEHYVIGFVEEGRRSLSCRNKKYEIDRGSLMLLNPGDNHACIQLDGEFWEYRGFNIPTDTMLELTAEITGEKFLPGFPDTVVSDPELLSCLRELHLLLMEGSAEFAKEELLLLSVASLIQKYGQPFTNCNTECPEEIAKACDFIDTHYAERISLDEICQHSGMSKSSLLRAFTKAKGITPYRYLETVRINEARKLLELGIAPVDAALQTGFSDQSHFSNFFSMFIGLAPGVYRDIFVSREECRGKEDGCDG